MSTMATSCLHCGRALTTHAATLGSAVLLKAGEPDLVVRRLTPACVRCARRITSSRVERLRALAATAPEPPSLSPRGRPPRPPAMRAASSAAVAPDPIAMCRSTTASPSVFGELRR